MFRALVLELNGGIVLILINTRLKVENLFTRPSYGKSLIYDL